MAHAGGRPTKYHSGIPKLVDEYLKTTGREQTHLPKLESLALYLEINKDTLYEWAKHHPEFSDALAKLMALQAQQLIDDGIYGGKEVNSTIVKLLLMNNHGMREEKKQEIQVGNIPGETFKQETLYSSELKQAIRDKITGVLEEELK